MSVSIPKLFNSGLNGSLLILRANVVRCMIASSGHESKLAISEGKSRYGQSVLKNCLHQSFANFRKHELEAISVNLSNATLDLFQSGGLVDANVAAFDVPVAIDKVRLAIFVVNDDSSIVLSWSQEQ